MAEPVSSALTELQGSLSNTLTKAKDLLAGTSVSNFVDHKVGCMFDGAVAYSQCFNRLDVSNREEMEAAVKKHYKDPGVQEKFEELLDSEKDWDGFLQEVDKQIQSQSNVDQVEVDFDAAGAQVLVVTFGVREGALRWLQETKYPYDMLMDPERKLYEAVGFHRSVFKVWFTGSMMYYGQQMATGRQLPAPYEDVEDDVHQFQGWSTGLLVQLAASMAAGESVSVPTYGPMQSSTWPCRDVNQMGGNAIIDAQGKVRLVHYSKVPQDRPTVEQLLTTVKN